jgi:dUTP pyrophosphatase
MLYDRIATFEKVSLKQYIKDCKELNKFGNFNEENIIEEYEKIKIPSRATSGSVGYDFYLPHDITLYAGDTIIIPTGIRCKIKDGYSLDIYPKSGLGFKHFTTIANTIGIIDSDYYDSDNEGHIMVKFINNGFNTARDPYNPLNQIDKILRRARGESFVQGIFHECFGATNDIDNTEMKVRNGGFDSTR